MRHLLSGLVLPILLYPNPTFAQDAKTSEDIVVTGQRGETSARTVQKQAPNIVNVQSAETIAKYPDVNAAEALSRIPGVALSIDTAEGRFVNIRGLDGNLNGATFGGVVLLNTQPGGTYFNAAGRAVEFDTVPIGAIDRIVVTKTGLPDHDAEGLGGTVELTPRTAVGLKRAFADITLGGGIETYRGTGLYRDEIVVGAPFGRNATGDPLFSAVVTQFLYNDRRTFDDIEAAYIDAQPATPDKAFDALELRQYAYRRRRFGYSGEFDITPDDANRLYLRASIAGYNERVRRNRLEIDGLGDPVATDATHHDGFVASGASVAKSLRDEDETHRNSVYQVGGVHHLSDLTIDWFAAYSRATYAKHYDYNSGFDGPDGLTVAYDNTTNPDLPTYAVRSGTSITDPAGYTLAKIGNAVERDVDREYSYAANAAIPLHLADTDALKIGAKLRYRRKTSDPVSYSDDYAGPTVTMASFVGGSDDDFYGDRYQLGATLDAAKLRAFLAANPGLFQASQSTGGGFDDTENVASGYAQYSATFDRLGVLGGLRVEHTHAVYRGATAAIARDYTNVFPTIQLRYTLAHDLVARAIWSTGISRPGFYQTIQTARVDAGSGSVLIGNPDLKPTYGNSFDASLEYYLPHDGILSVGVFDKEFRDYVVARAHQGSYPGITGIALINSFSNAAAHVRGVEAAASSRIPGLGGALRGFGIDANGTYVDGNAAIRAGERVALPGTFATSANLGLFYERGGIKLRLAAQHESKTLFGVGDSRATDIFQDSRDTLDASGTVAIGHGLTVYLNAKNLTDAPLRFYEGSAERPIQREFYNLTLESGIKIRL